MAARHQAVHSYRPDSDTVRDSCLDDVDSCDLYVLIVGHRYGFQPAEGNPEGLSITQLEFRRAGESGIPRVALLRTSIPDVRLSDMEDPERCGAGAGVSGARSPGRCARRSSVIRGGLIQGLSTGVQAELAKLGSETGGPVGPGRRARCCGWRRGRRSWPAGRSCWPSWTTG